MNEPRRKKRRTFYCENCRQEVSERDRICPHCGRFFSAIRCPRCSFTGGLKAFEKGCPACGYLAQPSVDPSARNEGFTLSDRKTNEKVLPRRLYSVLMIVLSVLLVGILVLYLRV